MCICFVYAHFLCTWYFRFQLDSGSCLLWWLGLVFKLHHTLWSSQFFHLLLAFFFNFTLIYLHKVTDKRFAIPFEFCHIGNRIHVPMWISVLEPALQFCLNAIFTLWVLLRNSSENRTISCAWIEIKFIMIAGNLGWLDESNTLDQSLRIRILLHHQVPSSLLQTISSAQSSALGSQLRDVPFLHS